MPSCLRCRKAAKIGALYKASLIPGERYTCEGCGAVHVRDRKRASIVNYSLILIVAFFLVGYIGGYIAAVVILLAFALMPWLMKWELG